MPDCHACGDPITGGSVPLDGPNSESVHVHGSCFLKGYPVKAFDEDQPKKWTHGAHAEYSLEEHIDAMIQDDSTPSDTYVS